SEACFASLLGSPEHGRWLLAPAEKDVRTTRRYLPDTLVLETRHETSSGTVRVLDFMPPRTGRPDLVRLVVGESGRVPMKMELVWRLGFGSTVPWVHRVEGGLQAIAGPDLVELVTPASLRGENLKTMADLAIGPGERVPFVLSWHPSHEARGERLDAERA